MKGSGTVDERFDVVVIGGGVVGLAHALAAHDRGARVAVVERDPAPTGASVRNFGHACVTAQEGQALDRALRARSRWIELAGAAGFWAGEVGTLVVARADDELAVLDELADRRGDQVRRLDPAGVRRHLASAPDDVVGGAHLPLDLRVNPREAVPRLAAWAAGLPGIDVRGGTACLGVEPGRVRTTAGNLRTDRTVVCLNHDVDRLLPEVAREAGVRRCWLQMLRVRPAAPVRVEPALLSGFSMLRYAAFERCPSSVAVRERLAADHPAALEADLNLMLTQLPDGDLLLGDTHARAETVDPFRREDWDRLLLEEGRRLLGVDRLEVVERWLGVYASAPEEFLEATPWPGLDVVSVTTGIGMTTAFGLAEDTVARW